MREREAAEDEGRVRAEHPRDRLERDVVPAWLLDELLDRLAAQRQLPAPLTRICRGRMFSRVDFEIDVREWGFADVVGDDPGRNASRLR